MANFQRYKPKQLLFKGSGFLAKQFAIEPWLNLTLVSQVGSYTSGFNFLNYEYLSLGVNRYDLSLAVGPYYANRTLTETVSKIAYTLAWSYFFRGFTLSGNYLSGDNNLSGLSANLAYSFNRYLQPYLGFGDVAPNLRCSQCTPYYYMAVGLNLNF
jgi:hypothetical protein